MRTDYPFGGRHEQCGQQQIPEHFLTQPRGEFSTKPGPGKLKARFTVSRYTVIVNACTHLGELCFSNCATLQFERTKAIIGE